MKHLVIGCLMLGLVAASCQKAESPLTAAFPLLSSYDEQARALLAQMTLEEKIGQMIQAEQAFLQDPYDIQTYYLGSILSGGNSDPTDGNSLEAWTEVYDSLQAIALRTRLGIPLLYGIDAVHGHSNVEGAVVFPHHIGLGATRDPDLVERVYRTTAIEMRATGIHWNFAPCIAVAQDIRWGRTYESFSEDPALVATLGAAAVRGLQHGGLNNPLAVLATTKHFAGDGGTVFGTGGPQGALLDQGDVRLDEATFRRIHVRPYIDAIQAGVGAIMVSYSSWNGVKMTGHKYMLTDVLKGELGFEGIVISDYNAIDQVHPDYKTAIEISINAGIDMAMVPTRYREFFQLLKALVEEGRVPMARIDDAVLRILRVKFAMGLMEGPERVFADRSLWAKFGSAEHRAVAREAVRKSLVLLKNENQTLPLARDLGRIHVAGWHADNLGYQMGGWTIDWQGGSGDITEGTTILEAIRKAVAPGTEVTYSEDGSGAAGADVAIAVIGERPYAEFLGDRSDLSLDPNDVAVVQRLKEAGVPVVVILISGRPMIINNVLEIADAFIAAWFPGSEGDGVADVLFGDYAPTGKLPFSWPRSMDQIPINVGDNPLFPYGYGLTY